MKPELHKQKSIDWSRRALAIEHNWADPEKGGGGGNRDHDPPKVLIASLPRDQADQYPARMGNADQQEPQPGQGQEPSQVRAKTS